MTAKPVIGVPVSVKLGGLDALLSIVQMPPGVPVACVGIDNGKNAAFMAKRILDLKS
jgi:5-(carboxyamino)imidazole ribonucleotide mutase